MLRSLAWTALLALGPLLAWRCVVVAVGPVRWRRCGPWIDPTVIAGAMMGLALLWQALPDDTLGFYAVFGVGGFWDVALGQLLLLIGSLVTAVAPRLGVDAPFEVLAWISVAAGLWLCRLAFALPRSPRRAVPLLLLAEACVFLVCAVGAGWTVLLLVWTAGQLNVWSLLVAILLIQDARYSHPPRSRSLIGWLWGVTGRLAPATMRSLGHSLKACRNLVRRRTSAKSAVERQSTGFSGVFRKISVLRDFLTGRKAPARWV